MELYPRIRKNSHLRVGDLFERSVRAHGERGFTVWCDGHAGITTGFDDALTHPFTGGRVPFIDGAFHTARHQLTVITRPYNTAYLTVVTWRNAKW